MSVKLFDAQLKSVPHVAFGTRFLPRLSTLLCLVSRCVHEQYLTDNYHLFV